MKIEIKGKNLRKVNQKEARKLIHKLFDLLSPYRKSDYNSLLVLNTKGD